MFAPFDLCYDDLRNPYCKSKSHLPAYRSHNRKCGLKEIEVSTV
jgi:hypothetical protein